MRFGNINLPSDKIYSDIHRLPYMRQFTLETAEQYKRHYDEDQFWHKLRRLATQVGAKVLYPALQLFYLLQSNDVPAKAKTLIIGALGYLILPADMVPDIIPALGYADDITAIMMAIRALNKYLTPDIKRQAKEQTEKILSR